MKNGIRVSLCAVLLMISSSALAKGVKWCSFEFYDGGALAGKENYLCDCDSSSEDVKEAADQGRTLNGPKGAKETRDSSGKISSVIVRTGTGLVQNYYRDKKECNIAIKPYADKLKANTAKEKASGDAYN